MKPAVRAVALVAMAGTLCAANTVFASDSATTPTPNSTSSALRVVVDPETGKLRAPTAAELQAQIASARAARVPDNSQVLPAEKVVQRHANGMLSVRLSQESLSMLKAATDANGKVEMQHTEAAPKSQAAEK